MVLASTKDPANASTASYEVVDGIPTYKLFIDGQWVDSSAGEVADDINPATGAVFARVQQAGEADIERAITAAHRIAVQRMHRPAGSNDVEMGNRAPRPAHQVKRFALVFFQPIYRGQGITDNLDMIV